jgi:hypothetical protein
LEAPAPIAVATSDTTTTFATKATRIPTAVA